MAEITILINCYNGEKFLEEAIDSVYAQTYSNWEIVFIDNCSTDNSYKIVRKYNEKLKYYKTPVNVSLCKARLFARPFIQGRYLCVLDVDDVWMPTKLEKQMEVMETNKQIGLCYSNTVYFNDKEEIRAYDTTMPSGMIFEQLLENYFLSLETVMVRKSVMDMYNLYFDGKYNVSSDAELFIKLSFFTECFYIDEVLGKWRFGHGSESEKSLCLFPYEYEILLKDLSMLVSGFEERYKKPIRELRSKIDNMYGICEWNRKNMSKARQHFLEAFKKNKKYIIPYFLSFVIDYKNYVKVRRQIKKI